MLKESSKSIGFDIREGRQKNLEDFIVYPSDEFEVQIPLAIEVKSSKHELLMRKGLRQLDDWVYELSGEEKIRKRRPSDNKPNTFHVSAGLPAGPDMHLKPHKGVLIFNGSIHDPFAKKLKDCVNQNDIEFVDKRFFCILPFQSLIKIANHFSEGKINKKQIWESIHNCSGLWKQDMC